MCLRDATRLYLQFLRAPFRLGVYEIVFMFFFVFLLFILPFFIRNTSYNLHGWKHFTIWGDISNSHFQKLVQSFRNPNTVYPCCIPSIFISKTSNDILGLPFRCSNNTSANLFSMGLISLLK